MNSRVRMIITAMALILTPLICFLVWYGVSRGKAWVFYIAVGIMVFMVIFGVFLLPLILEIRRKIKKRKGSVKDEDEIEITRVTEEEQKKKMQKSGIFLNRIRAQMAQFDYMTGHVRKNMRDDSAKELIKNTILSFLFLLVFLSFLALAFVGMATERSFFVILGILGLMGWVLMAILITVLIQKIKDIKLKKDIKEKSRESLAVVIKCNFISNQSLEVNESYRKIIKTKYSVKLLVEGEERYAISTVFLNEGEEVMVIFNPDKPGHCLIKSK